MPIAVTEEHESLRRTAERWLAAHCPPTEPREVAEAAPGQIDLPPVFEKMAAQGWLGLHLPEAYGGQGFTLAETAVVLEELGHALFPGPVLPTLLVSAALSATLSPAAAGEPHAARIGPLLSGLADGTLTGAVAFGAEPLATERQPDGTLVLPGAAVVRPVLGLPAARVVLVPLDLDGDGVVWAVLDREVLGAGIGGEALPGLDGTRAVGTLEFPAEGCTLAPDALLTVPDATVHGLALVLVAAESTGIARWCVETASDYAKVRVQFGRPIGQFQAVKHALADMLVASEQSAAVAWDAAAALSEDPADHPEAASRALERGHRRRHRARGRDALHQEVHPDPRGDRLHLGARRALLSEASHGQPPARDGR